MTEVYKFVNGIGPSFMSEIFKMATEKYNVRTKQNTMFKQGGLFKPTLNK